MLEHAIKDALHAAAQQRCEAASDPPQVRRNACANRLHLDVGQLGWDSACEEVVLKGDTLEGVPHRLGRRSASAR